MSSLSAASNSLFAKIAECLSNSNMLSSSLCIAALDTYISWQRELPEKSFLVELRSYFHTQTNTRAFDNFQRYLNNYATTLGAHELANHMIYPIRNHVGVTFLDDTEGAVTKIMHFLMPSKYLESDLKDLFEVKNWTKILDLLNTNILELRHQNQRLSKTLFGQILVEAARENEINIVRLILINQIINQNIENEAQAYNDALEVATRGGHLDLLQIFVDAGANFNQNTTSLQNPLRIAVSQEDVETVGFLIHNKAHVNAFDDEVPILLQLLTQTGSEDKKLKILKVFKKYLANLTILDKSGSSLLLIATSLDYNRIAKYLVENCRLEILQENHQGQTALSIAIESGNIELVNYFLNQLGQNYRTIERDLENEYSYIYKLLTENIYKLKNLRCEFSLKLINKLLILAMENNNIEVARLLLTDQNVRAYQESEEDYSVLREIIAHIAQANNLPMLEVYNDAEIRLNYDPESPLDPLRIAMFREDYEMIEFISKNNVYPGAFKNEVPLLFMLINQEGDEEKKIAILLLFKDYLNHEWALDESGSSLLLSAVSLRQIKIVKFLVEKGELDIQRENNRGKTALSIAIESNNEELVSYFLKQLGTNFRARASDLERALQNRELAIFELILDRRRQQQNQLGNTHYTDEDLNYLSLAESLGLDREVREIYTQRGYHDSLNRPRRNCDQCKNTTTAEASE